MTTDVEMKGPEEHEETPVEQSTGPSLEAVLDDNLHLIRKAVAARETSLMFWRVLRQTAGVRSRFTAEALIAFVQSALPDNSTIQSYLLSILQGQARENRLLHTYRAHAQRQNAFVKKHDMLTGCISHQRRIALHDSCRAAHQSKDGDNAMEGTTEKEGAEMGAALPEEEVYCLLLACQFLVDSKQYDQLFNVSNKGLAHIRRFNRRTLDVLSARIYQYLSLAYERADRIADLRSTLLELHCTCVLRHDDYGQEVLLNLLLRNYLNDNLYDQAEKLRAQAQRPESARSNQQQSRYLYYLGRIRAVQLEYSEAKDCLQQALRKAPLVAKGFSICVQKWLLVIRLLVGEIPARAEFEQRGMAIPLRPYLELTQAVRSGDVKCFNRVASTYQETFVKDRTFNLVNRLRYNVIRAGLHRISIAYSSISLKEVAAKLGLASAKETESVVAKTIHDGSISAVIDHERQILTSKAVSDVYLGSEPQQAFHARTAFCMDIHTESVKAMRYNEEDDAADEVRDPEPGFEEAIAAVIAEEDRDY